MWKNCCQTHYWRQSGTRMIRPILPWVFTWQCSGASVVVGALASSSLFGARNICSFAPEKPQLAQWVYSDLCQWYCWHKSMWTDEGRLSSRRGEELVGIAVAKSVPYPGPIFPPTHPCHLPTLPTPDPFLPLRTSLDLLHGPTWGSRLLCLLLCRASHSLLPAVSSPLALACHLSL